VKRSTALARLADVVDALDRAAQWPDTTVVAAYVYGELLTDTADLERVELVFVVDEPPEQVPWLARPPRLEALAAFSRFTKLPLSWQWRPAAWPVWNHTINRAVRFWSRDHHTDRAALEALASAHLESVTIEAPATTDALVAQLVVERDTARHHLTTTLDQYYDRDWRRDHRGATSYPEDHLWQAAAAWIELDNAINALSTTAEGLA
jgi:hypothetical protein